MEKAKSIRTILQCLLPSSSPSLFFTQKTILSSGRVGVQSFLNHYLQSWHESLQPIPSISDLPTSSNLPSKGITMGICWGAPNYPTPSFNGYLKPGQPPLTFSSTSDDEEDEIGKSLGGRINASHGAIPVTPNLRVFTLAKLKGATRNCFVGEKK